MKTFLQNIKIAAIFTLFTAIILGGLYPLIMWGIGAGLFPHQANGSLITNSQGQIIGSELIGQPFDAEYYFHPRPSAAGNGYDAGNSGGSNLGPTSKKLADAIKQRVDDYRKENSLAPNAEVPADAVTASASGLDPEISLNNAKIQAARVAKARNTDISSIQALIEKNTIQRSLGLFGEPGVNVLTLNIALDKNYPAQK
jgi:K+-transporting ATPase ATPase C chain